MPGSVSPSDYLTALSQRVLVFDGAMGTNIQRFHLSAEDFGGKSLEGCNDHLVLTRPDVIGGIHESFLAVGCDVVETCTFQSTPHRLREWGIEPRAHELNVAAARLARAACDRFATAGAPALRRRIDRPHRHAAVEQRPGALQHHLRPARRNLLRPGESARRGRSGRPADRDRAGHPRGQGGDGRIRAAVRRAGAPRAGAGAGHARPQRPHAARHRRRQRPHHARGAARGRDRPQLLHRARTHARAHPLSHRERVAPRLRASPTPGCRSTPAPATPCIRWSRSRWPPRSPSSSPSTERASWADAAAPRPNTSSHRRAACAPSPPPPAPGRRAPPPTCPRVSSAMRATSLATGPPPAAHRRARQCAGLAQGQAPAPRRRLRGHRRGRPRAGRTSGAHVLDVCVALTERADEAEQMAKLVKLLSMSVETAADDRLHRAGRSRSGAGARARPRRSSTPSTWRTAASASTPCCRSSAATAPRVVALTIDDAGHGQDRRAQARGGPRASTTSWSANTVWPPKT